MGLLLYFVPGLTTNLLSIGDLTSHGYKVEFGADVAHIFYGGSVVESAAMENNLYFVASSVGLTPPSSTVASVQVWDPRHRELEIWHRRLGHLSKDTIYRMAQSGLVDGLPPSLPRPGPIACRICSEVKIARRPVDPEAHATAPGPFHTISIDYLGPVDGQYFFQCIDVYSKFKLGRHVRDRTNSDLNLQFVLLQIQTLANQYNSSMRVVKVKCDNEFSNNSKVMDLCASRGITIVSTAADSSFSNGPVERFNQTVLNMTKCLLAESGRPLSFLPLAYKSAIYILNRTFATTATASGADWFVPFTRMSGVRVNVSHIRVWGADVTFRVPETQRVKADPRGHQGILVGFTANPENYLVLDAGTYNTRSTRDIIFHEFDKISAEYDRYLAGFDESTEEDVPPSPVRRPERPLPLSRAESTPQPDFDTELPPAPRGRRATAAPSGGGYRVQIDTRVQIRRGRASRLHQNSSQGVTTH